METAEIKKFPNLFIVPARGGSKGLPGKNKREMHGRPLVWWTLSFCEQLALGHCVLSSDDDEILKLASEFESCLPVPRPAMLATDTATDQGVLLHALEIAEAHLAQTFSRVIMLQPTSPGRRIDDLKAGLHAHELMKDPQNSSVWSAHKVPDKFHLWKQISQKGETFSVIRPNELPPRRQDLPTSYVRSGDFYVIGRDALQDPYLIGGELRVIEISGELVNIDTLGDFNYAKSVLSPRGVLLERRGEAE